MNGSQRYDYLGPTNIFLRNKEYERHQKKLEEIKSIKTKGTYYNKQHIEGIRVYNNIKVNNNKFKDRIKNDELQINNNKILKKIIDISRHDNGLSKTHFSQLSPRRANIEEVDKIIRENQILSNKINNVDSQLNNKKFASHYQLLYECKKRIQRFEVIDYEKNQVKLKAYDLANSTFNGGLTQAHSRLSQRKQSLNLNSNGNQDEFYENNDHYNQQEQNNSLGDTQNHHQKSQLSNYKQIQITTSQNSPRENQFDSGRAKSCERDRISVQRKNQQFQGQNQGYFNQKENYDNQTQNVKPQRQIGTSEQARYRSVSRGRGASTRSSYEPSKNPSDSQLPAHRYFRNFKRANPERQSLNLTSNSIGNQKLNVSDEQNLNKTGESNYKNSSNKSGISSKQTNEGDFYNEDGYGYGQEEENSTYYKKVPKRLNQNYIQKGEDTQSSDNKQSVETNKIAQQEKQNNIIQIKNNSRAYSAKGSQKDKLRSTTPNKNMINNTSNQQSQFKEEQGSSKNTPRGLVQIEQVDRSQIQSRQNDKNNRRQFNQHSDKLQGDNSKKMNNSQQQSKIIQESNYTKESFDIEENITSQSKQLNGQKDSKEDLNEEYNFEDEDFVQQEESYQIDDDTKKKFMNNSKNFYKDKKKEQYQIAEQEEYEEDFESQLIKSSNQQNKNQQDSQKMKVSNNQNTSKIQKKQEHDSNKFDDLESSKLNSSHNVSEVKTDKSKLISSQLKNEIKNQQNQDAKQVSKNKSNKKIANKDQEDSINKYEEENFELEE
ncbi:hypothetical protein TTHERM_00420330 (macronuclear) [Tetrahymena thermophila SB210]|uniref:Uncharacterized protein n=1 Tax=Tetrahymena thermophila (strain SB210) TaxID=312017 RepID=I7MD74_TETTS|nr:hypothetical protein TTHERM_00420330 [Tetrahymena thermophila SB210]EAR85625.2 hypothetical protein TTHERM_00420330 [Tetrahymena thermophila SB210]|eukprot:XP_001033288.2 hypothetical protein TTHERM_00420330 [Tetrahymena thermophila SB210]